MQENVNQIALQTVTQQYAHHIYVKLTVSMKYSQRRLNDFLMWIDFHILTIFFYFKYFEAMI